MNRKALAEKCAQKTLQDGHELFGCHCGRIHVDPMGIMNPQGWTPRELAWIYGGAVVTALILTGAFIYFGSFY